MNIFNKQKKGQAALEFLTTYGWAFLVILVMIGALAYFGVLDPTRFIPQRCQFGQELYCERFALTETQAAFNIRNNLPDTMQFAGAATVSVDYATDEDPTGWTACQGPGSDIQNPAGATVDFVNRNNAVDITCVFTGADGLTGGEKARRHFRILYSTGDSYTDTLAQTVYGEVFANVR